jgi:hypothetical protein
MDINPVEAPAPSPRPLNRPPPSMQDRIDPFISSLHVPATDPLRFHTALPTFIEAVQAYQFNPVTSPAFQSVLRALQKCPMPYLIITYSDLAQSGLLHLLPFIQPLLKPRMIDQLHPVYYTPTDRRLQASLPDLMPERSSPLYPREYPILEHIPTEPEANPQPHLTRSYSPTLLPNLLYQTAKFAHYKTPHGLHSIITHFLTSTASSPSLFHPIFTLICNLSLHDPEATSVCPDVDYIEALQSCLSSPASDPPSAHLARWLPFSRLSRSLVYGRHPHPDYCIRLAKQLSDYHSTLQPLSLYTHDTILAHFRKSSPSHLQAIHRLLDGVAPASILNCLEDRILGAGAEIPTGPASPPF